MFRNLLKHLSGWDLAVLLVSFVFVLIKIPFLNLPYFWDEAWVYAPAVFDMYENGPSLSPNSIDPFLSRGHPILFHFFAVCWMTVFGTDFVTVHAFSLFMSVLLIWSVYKLGSHLATPSIGFWAAAFFALQPIFMQQSGFLLPEVQLSLFTMLTILFYLKRKILWYVLAATALLLTKETGILLIGVIGLLEIVQFGWERNFSKSRILEFVSIGFPLILVFGYFLVQYYQFGWFMFPEHMSMFNTTPEVWTGARERAYNAVFTAQQRPLFLTLAFFGIAFGWKNGPRGLRIIFLIIGLTFTTMIGTGSWLPGWYYFWVFPVIIAIAAIWSGAFMYKADSKNHLFLPLVGLLSTIMILFTSAHFIIGRYLLFLIPLIIISVLILLNLALKKDTWLRNGILICLGLMLYHFANKADGRMTPHDNLKYKDQIMVMKEGIQHLEALNAYDDCIAATYILRDAMQNPMRGYLTSEQTFSCTSPGLEPNSRYALTLNFDNDAGSVAKAEKDSAFALVWEVKIGKQYAKIYERK